MICDNTSKGILSTLQFVLIDTGQTSKQRITIVQTTNFDRKHSSVFLGKCVVARPQWMQLIFTFVSFLASHLEGPAARR